MVFLTLKLSFLIYKYVYMLIVLTIYGYKVFFNFFDSFFIGFCIVINPVLLAVLKLTFLVLHLALNLIVEALILFYEYFGVTFTGKFYVYVHDVSVDLFYKTKFGRQILFVLVEFRNTFMILFNAKIKIIITIP